MRSERERRRHYGSNTVHREIAKYLREYKYVKGNLVSMWLDPVLEFYEEGKKTKRVHITDRQAAISLKGGAECKDITPPYYQVIEPEHLLMIPARRDPLKLTKVLSTNYGSIWVRGDIPWLRRTNGTMKIIKSRYDIPEEMLEYIEKALRWHL